MAEAIEAIEVGEFVKKLVSDIEGSVDRKLYDPIEIEISVTKTRKFEGNLKIYVASGGGEMEKAAIAKVRFKIPPNLNQILSADSSEKKQFWDYQRTQGVANPPYPFSNDK